jgi:LysM repeat protein
VIIGGNSGYYDDSPPIWLQPASTSLFSFGTSPTSSFGATGNALFSGHGAQMPFNPYDGPVASNPYNFTTSHNPFIAPTPVQPNHVVYAHYAPGQAMQGQQATTMPANTNASATGGGATTSAPKPAETKPAEAKPAEAKPAEAKPAEEKTVTVKRGDSLSKIAAAHGTTWQKLYETNKAAVGSNPNLIHPGLKLKLP